MKKIGLLVKEIAQNQIKNNIKEASAVFIIKYSGLSSPDLSSLRQNLKNSNASLFVVKNSVAKRAIKDPGLLGDLSDRADALAKAIEEPCGLVFTKDEPVGAARVLCNFTKEHEQLKLALAFLKDRILEKKDIEYIASLPSKEVLRAQVVMTLNAPISGLAIALNQILLKFVYCLDQIKQKKTNGGENNG